MTIDLTFITNEKNENLLSRFSFLIKDTRYFDCLVGYFYTSGFYSMYNSLEKTENIRILIGISTNKETLELLQLSDKEMKNEFSAQVIDEMDNSKYSTEVEKGIRKFIEWVKNGKLKIRAYPEKIHAKLYIMTFKEGDRDVGRVITGSSNFTISGLRDNIEFNVELKNRSDYEFALKKFNEFWKKSVDVSENYVETVKEKTWLNDTITPYELYLKFLYEYLKDKLNIDKEDIFNDYAPDNFMKLQYQKDAVIEAKTKLEEYGGVFISDVVGLGKTYISAMLANQLDSKNIVIAPPSLLDSWKNVFFDFGVRQTEFVSIGMLDKLIEKGTDKYKNVFIDESHRFRTENTQMYENLFKICRGKRVILVSATPLNNSPKDILSQIKLFQNAHNSTLPAPEAKDLEKYFTKLENRLKNLDRQNNKEEYLKIVKENAGDIRQNILQYLMVRRTRNDILKNYKEDLKTQNLKFPDVETPESVIYQFNDKLDTNFNETLEFIINKFKYSRYTPLLYLKDEFTQQKGPQQNMRKFMKVLLLKRLESSFYAFKKTVGRFIKSYKNFLAEYEKGNVYISKKYINKIYELLENDDEEGIQSLIENDKADKFSSNVFKSEFETDLKKDLDILEKIDKMWGSIEKDPKLDKFIEILSSDKILKDNKLIVFTESKETATYLEEKLNSKFDNKVLAFSGSSEESIRSKVIDNFDAKAKNKKDDYRILISTEVLSEGVNLHRSCVVINYDIPWNPTRMIQRVGRINRVDSKFDKIYTYNFFPAGPINENISLKEAAESKIKAFIEMLGNDAKILTDEEIIKSHELFDKLSSKKSLIDDGEDNPELKYLTFLRNIRDNDENLFEKIKKLPKKARTSKKYPQEHNSAITFFRKGKLRKIYKTNCYGVEEIDFIKAAEILKADANTKKEKIDDEFYNFVDDNKKKFDEVFFEDNELKKSGGKSVETKLYKIIKAIVKSKEFTDDDEEYLNNVLELLDDGAIPKATINKLLKEIKGNGNPLKILGVVRSSVTDELFQKTYVSGANITGKKEVILSEYLIRSD